MKKVLFLFVILAHFVWVSCQHATEGSTGAVDLSAIDPGKYDDTWWNRQPFRLVQANLSEMDALMDIDAYIKSMVDANATIALVNAGGIVAQYPTKLPFHFRNPLLKGDLVNTLIERLHAEGIRVIARFDFSKLNETLAAQKPEWLYLSAAGQHVNYNGQVHTCVNGGYQQDYSLEILTEAISTYPFDGIFFNMIGYQTSDYSGNQYGICQCANCKRRFYEISGYQLPARLGGMDDPVTIAYNDFRRVTSAELFNKIGDHIKMLNPRIMIYTYTDSGVDMIASESGGAVITNEIEWNYSATDNVKRVLNSYKDRSPANLLMYFQAMTFRYAGISRNLARVWLLESMLHGAPLAFGINGSLANYNDRIFIPELNHYYGFHKTYEKLFTNVQSVNKVALIRGSRGEYQGIMKILTEEHILYDLIEPSVIGTERLPRKLDEYEVLILAEVSSMDEKMINAIDEYVSNGGKILTTGFTSTSDEFGKQLNAIRLNSLGVYPDYERYMRAYSTYLYVSDSDKQTLGQHEFKDFGLMMVYSDFMKCRPKDNAIGYMNFLPQTKFGPPEKIYHSKDEITDYPGLVFNTYGKGKSVFIPWRLGDLYRFKGSYMHRTLFVSALQNLLHVEPTIHTNASPLIEMTHLANLNGKFEWIGMINHSGQVGASYREPVIIRDIDIRFKPMQPVKKIMLLNSGKSLPFKRQGEWIECTVPQVDDFEMMLCIYK